MQTNPYALRIEYLDVDGTLVATDQEGYIQDMDEYYAEHQVQPQVRDMIKHFRKVWGPERGNNRYLHDMFMTGGPQKQGNRFAGIRKTKGEH